MQSSNTALAPYNFEGRDVRILEKDGEFWFVASDVASMLGHRDAHNMVRTMDDDEKGTHRVSTPSGTQDAAVISEAGVYRAILQRRATKKVKAEHRERIARFQRWVFHEVLPSIRKTGGYNAAPAASGFDDFMKIVADPYALQKVLLEINSERIELREQVQELTPKAGALDRLSTANGSFTLTEAAKMLQIKRKDLTKYFLDNKLCYRRNGNRNILAYDKHRHRGLFEHKSTVVETDDGDLLVDQLRITPKGMAKLAEIFQMPLPFQYAGQIAGQATGVWS